MGMLDPIAPPASPLAFGGAMPFGGATSFAEAEALATAEAEGAVIDFEMGTFELLVSNIRQNGGLSATEKVDAIAALVQELRERTGDTGGDPGSMMVFKDNTNQYRWFAVHSNKFEDRTREIFSEKSHRRWADRVWQKSEFPALRLWHMPLDIGRADWVDYDDRGFMLSSGRFNSGMEQVAENLSKMKGLGCSHGYLYRAEDFHNGVYDAYRSYEVSVLPARRVANDLTAFFATEEVPMLTPERREFMVAVMGEDKTKSMEDGVGMLAQLAHEKGLSYKSIEDALLDDVAAEAAELAGTREFPPTEGDSGDSSGTDTNAEEQKCPDCDAMVPANEMAQHQQEVHGQAPADAATPAPEANLAAPGAAAQGQQGVTLPNPAVSPPLAAAPAAPAGPSVGQVLAGVGAILEGAGKLFDPAAPVDDPTDPGAANAAAFVEANKADPEPDGEPVDEEHPEPMAAVGEKAVVPDALEDPVLIAFKGAMSPLMEQVAALTQAQAEQAREIAGLKSSRDDAIAATIRPRVGPDFRIPDAAASRSEATIASPDEVRKVKEAGGGDGVKSDVAPGVAPARPYIGDLKGIMQTSLGQPAR